MAVVLLVAAALLGGCGRSGGAATTPTDEPSPTVEAKSGAEPPGTGSINTTFDAECHLTQYGAEIALTYAAHATGTLQVNRVWLRVDGRTVDDSGDIFVIDFEKTARVRARPGQRHVYQIIATANGRPPILARASVRCPDAPTGVQA